MTTTPEPPATEAEIVADLIAHCPEHGTSTETWMECRCAAARKAAATITAVASAGPTVDTLPEWLYQRFARYRRHAPAWSNLSDHDQDYWAHEAAAVRRAVARGGFKTPAADGAPAGEVR